MEKKNLSSDRYEMINCINERRRGSDSNCMFVFKFFLHVFVCSNDRYPKFLN